MDGYDEKDRRVVLGIACPLCKAGIGEFCFFTNRWKQAVLMGSPHRVRTRAYDRSRAVSAVEVANKVVDRHLKG